MNTIHILAILLIAIFAAIALHVIHARLRREEITNAAEPADAPEVKTPEETIAAEAAASIAETRDSEAPKGISEEEIAAKTDAGLTRDQAIETIQRQRDWDEQQAAEAKKSKAKG